MMTKGQRDAIENRRSEARKVVDKPSGFLSWRGAYDADVRALSELVETTREETLKHVETLLEKFIAGREESAILTRVEDARAIREVLEILRATVLKKGRG